MTRSTRLTVTLVMFCTADLTFSCTFSATEGIRAPNCIIRCRVMLAVAEMLFGGENKPGVAINEAVELT